MSIVTYFIVGGVSFLANLSVFLLLVQFAGLHWIAGNLLGFAAGTLINYVLSARLVFESRIFARRHFEAALTLLVSALGVGFETLLIHLAHDVAALPLLLSKIAAAGAVFFWNYGARRFLVFGATRPFDWPRGSRAAVTEGAPAASRNIEHDGRRG